MTAADPRTLPFRRERLLAVGLLAFLAPIPLAFSYAVEVRWMAGYLLAVGTFLLLVSRGRIPCLGHLFMNLAGLVYLFLFYADLRFGSRRLLIATLHLLLFTTVVKLASIRRERDLAVALALVGFLFLASVATSIHSAILVYLVLFLSVAWPILVRWGLYRELAGAEDEWHRDPGARELPGARATALSVLATILVGVPLFVTLPRLKTPFVRGMEEGREITTGFSETVDPDLFGLLKRSDKVYLRVSADGPISRIAPEAFRLRTLAFTRYTGRAWKKPVGPPRRGSAPAGSPILLPGVPPRASFRRPALAIDLLPLDSRFVPYPLGSPALRFPDDLFRSTGVVQLEFDPGRNVLLPMAPEQTVRYEALLGGAPIPDLAGPRADDPTREPADLPRVGEWARAAIGTVDPASDPQAAAARISRVLSTTFTYSLEIPRPGPSPTEEFLFERKTGHCETFASAMALALREIGIPSRFVTGFAGGEVGLLGRYLIVRGRNAHAWVEAWCGPERGWVSFDPTPSAGQPVIETVSLSQRFRLVGDGVELLYDRYILSFGQNDQMELFRRLRDAAGSAADRAKGAAAALGEAGPSLKRNLPFAAGAALVGLIVLARRSRRPGTGVPWGRRLPPAAAAYRRLQRILNRRGARLGPAASPGETLAAARARGAGEPAREIVLTYVAESFGGLPPGADVTARLAARLGEVKSRLSAAERKRAA